MLNTKTLPRTLRGALLGLVLAGLVAGTSSAAEYWLWAGAFNATMPDGSTVPMWGFAEETDGSFANGLQGTPSVPGPILVVPPGEGLTIHLYNNLSAAQGGEAISLVIPGQALPDPTPNRSGARATSFTKEVAIGAEDTYAWASIQPGSYLYHSGSHAAIQVQMGLYGALTADFVAGQAYNGVAYTSQVLLFYSEVNAEVHNAVVTNDFGAGKAITSTLEYHPAYFLINGAGYPAAAPIYSGPIAQTDTLLIRFFNAGLRTRVPIFKDLYPTYVAENGFLYPHPREAFGQFLPALATLDATLAPPLPRGGHWLLDRRFELAAQPGVPGGQITQIVIDQNPPVAVADAYAATEDTPLVVAAPGVLVNDTDPDVGDTLTAAIVTQPSNGAVTLADDGSFTYTPAANFNGSDTFTYSASDSFTYSAPATVTITVAATPDAPVAHGQTINRPEDTSFAITLRATDPDGPNPSLTYSIVGLPTHGNLTGSGATRTYTPDLNYNGPDSFTFMANDPTPGTPNGGDSNVATVTINITPVSDAPTATSQSVSTPEDTPLGITLSGTDPEGQPLTFTVLTQPANGSVTGTPPNVTYSPNPNYNGPDSFTFRASDGTLDSAAATISIDVTPVNDAPTANAQVVSTNEDTQVLITLTGSDIEGSPLTFQLVTLPSHGVLSGTPPALTYTPAANYFGVDGFTFRANDGDLNSPPAAVDLTVLPVNDLPVAGADAYLVLRNGQVSVPAAGVLANDSDVEGTPLSAVKLTDPTNGTVTLNANGSLTYAPFANYVGVDAFTYVADDGTGQSAPAVVTVYVSSPADFNADGNSDIVWRSPANGRNSIWYMNGTIRSGASSILSVSSSTWNIGGVGDFNGDGKPDLLWRDASSGRNSVWYMNNASRIGASTVLTQNTAWTIGGVGDFNVDGKPDILWRNNATGGNVVWLMNGITRTASIALPNLLGGWAAVGVADFNFDGRADILFRDPSTGDQLTWYMQGSAKIGEAAGTGEPNLSILPEVVADYSKDGKPDIVVRNYTAGSGVNTVWLMDGLTRTGTTGIPSVTDLTWKMMGPR